MRNRELARICNRRYEIKHRERIRQRRAEIIRNETSERREKRLALQRIKDKRYYERHREEVLARKASAHLENPSIKRERRRRYYAANAELERLKQRRRYQLKREYYARMQREYDK